MRTRARAALLAGLGCAALVAAQAPALAGQTYWVPVTQHLTVLGHGYGHGHGLSQYGAQGAALKGLSYRKILRFYYPKTQLSSMHGRVRVLITADTTSDVQVSPRRGLRVRDLGAGRTTVLPDKSGADRWRIKPGRGTAAGRSVVQYRTSRNGEWHRWRVLSGDGQFSAAGAPVTLWVPSGDGTVAHRYRGALRAASPSRGAADRDTVNVLPMDDYVAGVVAYEMPASWRPAALKAQAVAARTYAAWERAQNLHGYYQICDTTSCQVYGGVAAETPSTLSAVAATAHRILRYDGRPAFTQFSASDGGWTAAGGVPYLPAKKDPYDGWSGNGVHSWRVGLDAGRLGAAYPRIGRLQKIRVTQRTGDGAWGGRVVQLVVVGKRGTVDLSGDDFRFLFGLRSSWFLARPTPIIARWRSLGGRTSVLGPVRSAEYPIPGGSGQVFDHGRIYWSSATGAHELYGRLLGAYRSRGGPDSAMGFPRRGLVRIDGGGSRTVLEHGRMYWSRHTGAHLLTGRISIRYVHLRQTRSRLGFPTSNVYEVPVGQRARFEGGTITFDKSDGSVVVRYHD